MENLKTLYRAIRKAAIDRDYYWTTFTADHIDRAKVYNINNHTVNALIRDYKLNGGKRDVSRYFAADKEIPGAKSGEPSSK